VGHHAAAHGALEADSGFDAVSGGAVSVVSGHKLRCHSGALA
jgi:hypothetical protein